MSQKRNKQNGDRPRDSKGRFTRKNKQEAAPNSEPQQPKKQPIPVDASLTTTRRDSYQDPGSGWTTERESAAYRAGADLRQLLEEYLSGNRQLLYSPPDWANKAVDSQLAAIKRELARQNRLRQKQVYSQLLSWNTYSMLIGLVAIGGVNIYVALATQFGLPLGPYADRGFVGTTDAIYTKEVKEGDVINGYEVLSGFGERTAPDTNQGKGSSFHEGVDLATPEGVNVYMIGEGGTVECLNQPEGAGLYAEITPKGLPYTFKAMHLSKCESGEYQAGVAFGQTGNTGNSSGPHLHWGMFKDGKAIVPTEGYLLWALWGYPPKPHGGTTAITGFGGVDDFAARITQQESGGDISVVNEIGAMGKYQFMPETLDGLSQSCFGRQVSHDEFLASETMQDQAVKCFWQPAMQEIQQQTSDPLQQCRMLASYHYSGDINLWDSTTPQDGYPSIADYTLSVCK